MIGDFFGAAFPWIFIGFAVAVACCLLGKNKNNE